MATPKHIVTEEELYYFDLRGYLVVRDVLTDKEIKACNDAIDHHAELLAERLLGSQTRGSKALSGGKAGRSELWGILEWPDEFRKPFRKLLVHPVVVARLTAFCGKGFRLDHGPWLISGKKGTDGATLHGAGEPFSPGDWYHQQNGQIFCRAVTVTWQFTDAYAGAGGFCIVPGSHKSNEPKPDGLITMEEDMGLVVQPEMNAGDVVFFAEAATHGTLPWTADHDRRSVLYKYTERAACRDVGSYFTPQERHGDWVNELTPEQQAVLYGPGVHTAGKPLPYLESDGKKTWISGERIGQDVRGGTVKKT